MLGRGRIHGNKGVQGIFLNQAKHVVHLLFHLHQGDGRRGKKAIVHVFEGKCSLRFLLLFNYEAGILTTDPDFIKQTLLHFEQIGSKEECMKCKIKICPGKFYN